MATKNTQDITEGLAKLNAIVNFFSDIDPEMQLQMIRLLLTVAEHPDGISMPQLVLKAKVSGASMSRNVSVLGQYGSGKRKALKWVYSTEDPEERRRKVVFLTPLGKEIVTLLTEMVNK